jgi:hypothetical protein
MRTARTQLGQDCGQSAKAFQVMHGKEQVHVRQHGANAGGLCFKCRIAQQGIEPDEPTAVELERFHLLFQAVCIVAVESVADEKHRLTLPHQTPRPAPVELLQTQADARSARPVLHLFRHVVQRKIDVPMPQGTGDVGQPRAARFDRAAVDQYSTAPLLAGVASDVGAGQVQALTDELHEQQARIDLRAGDSRPRRHHMNRVLVEKQGESVLPLLIKDQSNPLPIVFDQTSVNVVAFNGGLRGQEYEYDRS